MCSKFLHLYRQTEAIRVSVSIHSNFVSLTSFSFFLRCLYVNIFIKAKKKKKRKKGGEKSVFDVESRQGGSFDLDRILALMWITSLICVSPADFQSQCNFVQLLQVFMNNLMRLGTAMMITEVMGLDV